ncbi:MAG: P1 family peptidase [Bulleidia sp.]
MYNIQKIRIQDIEGYRIGNAEYEEYATGVTVILPEKGAVTGVDIRGGGPASRESGLLNPLAANDCVNAVVLSGGSAFGLDTASGVMKYLEEKGIGFPTGAGVVPIVCASCIFDLVLDNTKRPDAELGYQACINAQSYHYQDGNYGGGLGATCGKIAGPAHMMKSGIGSAAFQCGDLKVGAVVIVNCAGDVFDFETGQKIAGCYDYDRQVFISGEDTFYAMQKSPDLFHANTTIGAILTNASFNKTQLTKIAGMAHDGMARSINPVHTEFDGDTIYAMANGTVSADINIVGTLAARAFSCAVSNAVYAAEPYRNLTTASLIRK